MIAAGLLMAVVAVGGYLVSCLLRPTKDCDACKGEGEVPGGSWWRSGRTQPCGRCGGLGFQSRAGARLIDRIRSDGP